MYSNVCISVQIKKTKVVISGCQPKLNLSVICHNLTLKEPGFLDPSHSPGGGGGVDSAPLRSRKPIDETSSVWYQWIAMTLLSPLVPKKVQTYLV